VFGLTWLAAWRSHEPGTTILLEGSWTLRDLAGSADDEASMADCVRLRASPASSRRLPRAFPLSLSLLFLTVIGLGCEDGTGLPYAASAPPAGLVLNVSIARDPAATTRAGSSQRGMVIGFPSGVRQLQVIVGELPDIEVDQFFEVSLVPGAEQSLNVSGISAGNNKRVVLRAFDVTGNVVLSELEFRLNFSPGRITSNDPEIDPFGAAGFNNVTIPDALQYCVNFDEVPITIDLGGKFAMSPCDSAPMSASEGVTVTGVGLGGSSAYYPNGDVGVITEALGFRDETIPFIGAKICVEASIKFVRVSDLNEYRVGIGFRREQEDVSPCGTPIGSAKEQFDSGFLLSHGMPTSDNVEFLVFNEGSTMVDSIGSVGISDDIYHVYTLCVSPNGITEFSIDGQLALPPFQGPMGGVQLPAFIFGDGVESGGSMRRFVDNFKVFQRFPGVSGPAYTGTLVPCN